MTDSTNIEDHIGAEVKVFKDFKSQKSLEPQPGLPIAENRFREYVVKYSTRAFDELTTVVGLDESAIEPIKIGNSVVLGPEDRQKVVNHIFSVSGLSEVVRKSNNIDYSSNDAIRRSLYLRDSINKLDSDLEIIITGPLVSLEFKSTKAMALFKALSSGNPYGMFMPMPIGVKEVNGKKELVISEVTYLNFLDLEAEKTNGQSVAQHEQWHTIDKFRQLVYSLELKDDPEFKKDSLFESDPDKFIQRLGAYLYNPVELQQQMISLRELCPELYDYYVRIPIDENSFKRGLQKAQDELGASIAGSIKEGNNEGLTAEEGDQLDELIMRYLPFATVDIEDLGWLVTKDEDGRKIIDPERIEDTFNPRVASIGEPLSEWIAILDKYSHKSKDSWYRRDVTERQKYIDDLQLIVDCFLNSEGYGHNTMGKIRVSISKSVDSFRELAALRGDPHRALFELSLLPISHWTVYVNREQTKISN